MPSKRKKKAILTAKMRRFIELYPESSVPEQAVLDAGCNTKNPKNMLRKLVNHPVIKLRLDFNAARRRKRREATEGNIMDELSKLGFANVLDFFSEEGQALPIEAIPRDVAAAVKELDFSRTEEGEKVSQSLRLKLHDKKVALEQLGKRTGMWTDKVEAEGTLGLAFIRSLSPTLGPTGNLIEQQESDKKTP